MEMNNETKFSCSHGEEMLAYLYDELSPDGRERFETHMESCFECIDEFAELAFSRYSVFEWKSLEFAPLPTPKFVVPVERNRRRHLGSTGFGQHSRGTDGLWPVVRRRSRYSP